VSLSFKDYSIFLFKGGYFSNYYNLAVIKLIVSTFSSFVNPGVVEGYSISGKTSGQINRWNFPCLKLPL
jgi:hypothetical protein